MEKENAFKIKKTYNMRIFKPSQRMKDNLELIQEVKGELKKDKITNDEVKNCLLSDISVSLAMIAEILNMIVIVNKENNNTEMGSTE